jgi:hypothetical protein
MYDARGKDASRISGWFSRESELFRALNSWNVQDSPAMGLTVWSQRASAILILAAAVAACGGSTVTVDTSPVADLPLTADGIGPVALGAEPDQVVAELTAVLGGPSSDTGWLDDGSGVYGSCPLPLRVVSWGSLTTFHTGGPDAGRFFAYSYGFDFAEALAGVDSRNLNLTTPEGIGIGSTVAELRDLDAPLTIAGDETIDVWTFVIDGDTAPHLRGQISGIDPDDTVLFIETSTGCE